MAGKNNQKGLLVILSGPSGVGKSTITQAVRERLGAELSISMTTRDIRSGEEDGVNYHFVSHKHFKQEVLLGNLLEYAEVYGNYYGTPKDPVECVLADEGVMLLEIDVKGARQVKARMPDAFAVFINPPSEETLLTRLRSRGREGEEIIQKRYAAARKEMAEAKDCGAYDAFVVNANLEKAIGEVCVLIAGARKR